MCSDDSPVGYKGFVTGRVLQSTKYAVGVEKKIGVQPCVLRLGFGCSAFSSSEGQKRTRKKKKKKEEGGRRETWKSAAVEGQIFCGSRRRIKVEAGAWCS